MKAFFKLKYFFITIIVFVIIWLFSLLPVNLGLFNPLRNALYDFDLNDIAFSKLNNDRAADTNIVIVNIGYLNRLELANLITKIKNFNPKVVGIDAFFKENKDPISDSLLEEAINLDGNTVLVNNLGDYNKNKKQYENLASSISRFSNNSFAGYANLPSKDASSLTTFRLFKPRSNVRDSLVNAFAVQIVKLYDPVSYNYLLRRNNDFETIDYRGNADKFFYIDGTNPENLDNAYFIRNKIVLLGFLGSYPSNRILEDIYYTPLNKNYAGKTVPDMYGVVIHANIISMILDKDYINSFPSWIELLLAMVLCYLNVVILNLIKEIKIDWLNLAGVITKTVEFILLLFIDLEIFIRFHFKISITLMLASIVLISNAQTIYEIIAEHIQKLRQKHMKIV